MVAISYMWTEEWIFKTLILINLKFKAMYVAGVPH